MAFRLTKIPAAELLLLRGEIPLVDVRSPGEYNQGHIPGAVNIPLFDDAQRAEVGTVYKKEGNVKAVLRGIDLAAPEMSLKLRRAIGLSAGGRLMIYCWRGGMRSESMAWLFSTGGIDTLVLNGGYKAYRSHVMEELDRERRYIILGGLTGSGKTGILRHMKSLGNRVTDLEGLASHRGSAFGALGQAPQPSTEHFANLLTDDLAPARENETIWLEDESRNIGTVFMPDCFYARMQASPVIALMMSIETRMPRLLREYTQFPLEEIIASVMRISKRLGGDRTKEAVEALKQGDYRTAIRITLEYYDKTYHYGLSKRPHGQVIYINTESDDEAVNSALVAGAAEKLR
jgi:tRNA 2-selenouridine synthase